MSKLQTKNSPEIQDIKEDLSSLKREAVSTSQNLKNISVFQAQQVRKAFAEGFNKLQTTSEAQIKKLENQVRATPLQALGIAFVTGVVVNILLRRR